MKKLIALVLFVVLVLSLGTFAIAEEESQYTQFEKVLLTKGSLIKKEFITISSFLAKLGSTSRYDEIESQAAIITEMTSSTKYYALRLEHSYYNSKYDSGTSVEILDLEEIDSVIATLNCFKDEFAGEVVDYTEYVYTSTSGLTIGAYHSSSGNKLFIKFSSSDKVYMEFDRLDDWIAFFEEAKTTIEGMQ